MKGLDDKIIVYDSNCSVCSALRDVILRVTSVPEAQVRAFKELTPELSERVDPERFRNAMALIDTRRDEPTLYGEEGVAYVFASQFRIADLLLRYRPLFILFKLFYRVIAYNRYIIATPRSRFLCDCFLDRVVHYRLAYVTITILLSAFVTALFGMSLKDFFPSVSSVAGAGQMLLIAGSGWIIQIALAITVLRRQALDYIGHLASIMAVGVAILVPWIFLHFFFGLMEPLIPLVSVAASSITMLWLHIQRTRFLDLSQVWTACWFLLLQLTASIWILAFHFG